MAKTDEIIEQGERSPAKQKRPPKGEMRKVREELILARKVAGQTHKEIAEAFGISITTVTRDIAAAKLDGTYELARNFVRGRLLVKALAVYDTALDMMDVDVARDVLQGLGLTGTKHIELTAKAKVSEDFDAWRVRKAQALEAKTIDATASEGEPEGRRNEPSSPEPAQETAPGDVEILGE